MGVMAARTQKPLELILARNLLTSISTPAFLLDEHGAMVFYNEAAGALLGRSFEAAGRMSAEEGISASGPLGDAG
jgi:PAS domain-containing protein